jgi:phosphatidylinositol alpha-1,6-mannosyltransferase
MTAASMGAGTAPRALLLTPSRGLGGGIERYVETLEAAFVQAGLDYGRIDLSRPGVTAYREMLTAAVARVRASGKPPRLIVAHPRLLPVAVWVARQAHVDGISVLCYGSDVWISRFRPRYQLEKALMRKDGVRAVAISSFTAGALFIVTPATILPPAVSHEWYSTLVRASTLPAPDKRGVELVTVFRLADWRDKGLPQLLEAVAALGRPDAHLTVFGVGTAPAELTRFVSRYERCALRSGVSDEELARGLAAADLLVLATRTRTGRRASGEGFGLVLLEAQLAGTPVIAPAFGGSHDAFVDQVTGLAPAGESVEALAKVLNELLNDPARLAHMGKRASEWAREAFAPERYASLVVARLL